MKEFDVIVIGGGPAGLIAAGHAAEYGRNVLLLEKNTHVGEKLKLTGGGRCNITNAEFDPRNFLSFFGDDGKFLFSPFSRFAVQETFDFFADRGLPLVIEERKRAFPHTQKATDVIQTLIDYLHENNVTIRTQTTVQNINPTDGCVETDRGIFHAENIILATGGTSYRTTGSTGDGLDWLKKLGHTVHAASPDIVPLRVKNSWVKALSGTTLDSMKITFKATNGNSFSKTGPILFTHFGLSGPLILNSANEVKKLLRYGHVLANIDLFPNTEPHLLDQRILKIFNENKNKIVRNTLKALTPLGMTKAFAAHFPIELLEKKVNSVTQAERKLILKTLKDLPLTVTGTMGYDWAVISDGGVDLREIDTRTMASRLYPNLFIVGDLLHISRLSGGFSLQLCWTTGWVAGENA